MKSFAEYKKDNTEILSENALPDETTWKKWKDLVNMTQKEIQEFYDSEDGKDAGMTSKDAKSVGISSGRESAAWLLKMIPHGNSFKEAENHWTPIMWKWARKQISFISRMNGMRKRIVGNPFEKDGKKTRWIKSMLIWGHDPRK